MYKSKDSFVKEILTLTDYDLNDFEKFCVLFFLELSDFSNFIDFAPEYLFPVVTQSDLIWYLMRTHVFIFGEIDNLSNDLPH